MHQNTASKSYDAIVQDYPNLSPLFDYIEKKVDRDSMEWNHEIELTLNDRNRLLYCQGALLMWKINLWAMSLLLMTFQS